MARIIEYDETDSGGSRGSGGSGGGAAALVVVVLILLYMSGYMPGFNNTSAAYGQRGYVAPATAGITIPAGNISYVSADRLNMREAPGSYSMITYILPRGTRVTLLGDSYRDPNGEVWVQVRIDTYEGLQTGWVNRQYVS
ncbi:MAG: SH3 domain-containing protein [Blastocatellia bacterium]